MADIFVSYAREDGDRVAPLVDLLEAYGCSVWWDRRLAPGADFEREIDLALAEASCVIVALTQHAPESTWIRAESATGQGHGRVIPVLLDDVVIPLSLRAIHFADLRGWSGGMSAQAAQLLASVTVNLHQDEKPLLGRDEALAALEGCLDRASEGQGGVVLVSGEPGIGKTRCAEALVALAEDQGALPLWGQCSEQAGAPAYWPWIQVLRDYAEANTDDELRVLLGRNAPSIAGLVPEIGERLGLATGTDTDLTDLGNRFQFFDAISRALVKASAVTPQVLILDDLHWADPSSLAFLEHLSREIRRARVLVVCTYRDVEVTRTAPVRATLGELGRAEHVTRIRLTGLDLDNTGALTMNLAGMPLPKHVVEAIFQQTDGNPLFITEIANDISQVREAGSGDLLTIDVPDGVRAAIGRRLDRLSSPCNEVLAVASVIGREFDARVLAAAMDLGLKTCLRELDTAAEAGIVARYGRTPTAHRFRHAVIRETLLEEQSTLDRLQLHRRIAAALREIYTNREDEVLSELAHHYCEASALGEPEVAVDYALLAAEHSTRMLAFEDAIRLYDEAQHVLSVNGLEADSRLARICREQGRLYEALGRFGEALRCHTEGIGIARAQSQPDLFAEMTTAMVFIVSDTAPTHALPLLEEALRLLPDDAEQRALVKAHLAFASRCGGDLSRVAGLGAEAIELARAADDPATLSRVLQLTVMGLRGFPEALEQRLEYGREMSAAQVGRQPSQDGLHSFFYHLLSCVEAGLMDEFEGLYRRYANEVSMSRMPHHEYYVMNLDIMLRLLRGEWQGLEERIEKALTHAEKIWRGAEGVYGVQMFALNRELGRLPALAPLLQRMAADQEQKLWPPGYMLMCCEAGLDDAARRTFETMAADSFSAISRDDLWLACIVFCAETCAHLGDVARAGVLFELLQPYAAQVASHPNGVCFGAVDAYLGMLAALIGDRENACTHFESAIATHRRLNAWPLLARTQVHFARTLFDSEVAEDRAAGRKLLGEAEQLAERFKLAGVTAIIASLSDADANTLPDDLSPREAEVLKLIAIGRNNKDIARVLSISLSTVATHVRSILGKTGCANRTEAAAYAMREQLA